jgi:hypothetical protein
MVCGDGGGSCGNSLLEALCAGLIATCNSTHILTRAVGLHSYMHIPMQSCKHIYRQIQRHIACIHTNTYVDTHKDKCIYMFSSRNSCNACIEHTYKHIAK